MAAITDGSSSVDVSCVIFSPFAMALKILLIILPERVLGSPLTKTTSSHKAIFPISFTLIKNMEILQIEN